jgi:hypothetical protein
VRTRVGGEFKCRGAPWDLSDVSVRVRERHAAKQPPISLCECDSRMTVARHSARARKRDNRKPELTLRAFAAGKRSRRVVIGWPRQETIGCTSAFAPAPLEAQSDYQEPHLSPPRTTSPPQDDCPPPAVGVAQTWTVSITPLVPSFACLVFTNVPYTSRGRPRATPAIHHLPASLHPARHL